MSDHEAGPGQGPPGDVTQPDLVLRGRAAAMLAGTSRCLWIGSRGAGEPLRASPKRVRAQAWFVLASLLDDRLLTLSEVRPIDDGQWLQWIRKRSRCSGRVGVPRIVRDGRPKGYVTIRWYGSSNGYRSEIASFCRIERDE